MLDEDLINDDSPGAIADFLLTMPGLNKDVLGQFLGKNSKTNIAILQAFAGKIKFEDIRIDEALRFYLSLYKLPGEA